MNTGFDSDDNPLRDDELPDDAYLGDGDWDDDEAELIDCPACGAEIYEEAEQCPVCGEYVLPDNHVWSGRPAWWVVLGVLGLLATMAMLTLH